MQRSAEYTPNECQVLRKRRERYGHYPKSRTPLRDAPEHLRCIVRASLEQEKINMKSYAALATVLALSVLLTPSAAQDPPEKLSPEQEQAVADIKKLG
jgi:hypothetical protein